MKLHHIFAYAVLCFTVGSYAASPVQGKRDLSVTRSLLDTDDQTVDDTGNFADDLDELYSIEEGNEEYTDDDDDDDKDAAAGDMLEAADSETLKKAAEEGEESSEPTGGPYKWATPPGRQIFYVTIGLASLFLFWLGISFCCCFCNACCTEPCCIDRRWFMGIPTVLSVFAMLFGFLMCLGISNGHGESVSLSWMKTGSMVGGVYSVKMIDALEPPKLMAGGEEFPRSSLYNQGAVVITWGQCVDLLGSDVAAAYADRSLTATSSTSSSRNSLRGLSIEIADQFTSRMLPAAATTAQNKAATDFTNRFGDGCDRCQRLSGAVTAFTILATVFMIPMFVCTATRTNFSYDTRCLKFTTVLMTAMVVMFQAAALFLYEFGCAVYIANDTTHRGNGFILGIVSFSCTVTILVMNLMLAYPRDGGMVRTRTRKYKSVPQDA